MKPQLIVTISRSPSALVRTTGAIYRGKIAFNGSKATARLWETRKKRATPSRFGASGSGSTGCTFPLHEYPVTVIMTC
jgi:hypothetical protein